MASINPVTNILELDSNDKVCTPANTMIPMYKLIELYVSYVYEKCINYQLIWSSEDFGQSL